MAILDKMSILKASDLKRETVQVPEWGDGAEVIVSEMSALDRDRFNAETGILEFHPAKSSDGKELLDDKGEPVLLPDPTATINYMARYLVRCIIGEDGTRLFVDEEAEALGAKNRHALERLFTVAQKLNKFEPGAGDTETKN